MPEKTRPKAIIIAVTETEKRSFADAAYAARLPMSVYIRELHKALSQDFLKSRNKDIHE